jgi:hypothetical protein
MKRRAVAAAVQMKVQGSGQLVAKKKFDDFWRNRRNQGVFRF